MAAKGLAWPLIEGTGVHYGAFVVTDINETKAEFFHDGAASRIDFDLTLEHVDDSRRVTLGTLTPADVNAYMLGRSAGSLLF